MLEERERGREEERKGKKKGGNDSGGCGDKLLARSRSEENRDNNNALYTWAPKACNFQGRGCRRTSQLKEVSQSEVKCTLCQPVTFI